MQSRAHVAGMGTIPFARPSRAEANDVMARNAQMAALADAGLDYPSIKQAYVGYVYGDRQVENVKLALQHNLGLGGAAVVTLYERAAGASS